MAPAPYAAAPGPLGPPAVSGAGAPCGRGRPRGGGPPAPKGGGLGQLRYAAGRVQAGPVLARPGRPRPNRSGPALSGPGPWALAAVGVGWWLAAGPPARGRPASGLVAGRPKTGGRHPPAGGALPWWRWPGRWLRPPGRGVGGLACARAPPAPYPTSPGGGPPSGPAAGWGRPPVWGPPVVLFGLAPAAARGARGPPAPHPSQRPG